MRRGAEDHVAELEAELEGRRVEVGRLRDRGVPADAAQALVAYRRAERVERMAQCRAAATAAMRRASRAEVPTQTEGQPEEQRPTVDGEKLDELKGQVGALSGVVERMQEALWHVAAAGAARAGKALRGRRGGIALGMRRVVASGERPAAAVVGAEVQTTPRRSGGRQRRAMCVARPVPRPACRRSTLRPWAPAFVPAALAMRHFEAAAAARGIDVGGEVV